MADHAVFIHLALSDEKFGTEDERESIHELSDRLEEAIHRSGAGEFDGDEFGEGQCTLFMYGPDADALFSVVEPIFRESPHAKGAYAIKRYGEVDDDAREERIEF